MASNPAIYTDLEARWRPLSVAEQTVATALLADAWQIMLSRVPFLSSRLDIVPPAAAAELSVDLVTAVECAMVLRVLKNPDGKRQESIDDYSWMRDNAVSAGLLYLTDDELSDLSPAGASTDAFTITPFGTPGYSGRPIDWFELNIQ